MSSRVKAQKEARRKKDKLAAQNSSQTKELSQTKEVSCEEGREWRKVKAPSLVHTLNPFSGSLRSPQLMRRNLEAKLKHKIAKKMILQEFDSLYPKPITSVTSLTNEGDYLVDNRQTRAAALVIDSTKNMVYSMSEEVRWTRNGAGEQQNDKLLTFPTPSPV